VELSAGIDFIKLDFGRKVFRLSFTAEFRTHFLHKILDKCAPKIILNGILMVLHKEAMKTNIYDLIFDHFHFYIHIENFRPKLFRNIDARTRSTSAIMNAWNASIRSDVIRAVVDAIDFK
jgi:hypothetical protein